MIDLTFEDIRKLTRDIAEPPKAEDWVDCRECKVFVNRFKMDTLGEFGFCSFFGGVRSAVDGCYSGAKKEEEEDE